MADSPLAGQVAIVTGAGRGIGRAIAATLTAQDAAIVVADLSLEAAQGMVDELGA